MSANYVLGFAFDSEVKRVLLLRKSKPDWQRGRLNGVGGKVEDNEAESSAMRREAAEEIGLVCDWEHFCYMNGPDWSVDCFWAIAPDFDSLISCEDELIERVPIAALPCDIVANLSWLIPMAVDSLTHGFSATIAYKS